MPRSMKCGTTRAAATKAARIIPPIQIIFFIPPTLPRILQGRAAEEHVSITSRTVPTLRFHYGSGQEEDLLAYQLLRGLDEFGTRTRYFTTSTCGRHRIGFYVRFDRSGLHHGLRGLGVYQFCPQRDLCSWRLCRRGDPSAARKRRPSGHAPHGLRLVARDS